MVLISLENIEHPDVCCIKIDKNVKNFTKWFKNIISTYKKMVSMNTLDLFCGCGGFSTGLKDAGLNIVAGIDIWDKAIQTYKNNHDGISLCEDLTIYSPEKFCEKNKISNIDVIIGGPPCQGFSMAGKRDLNDPRNSLFMEFSKYIEFFKPKIFVMENVIGILSQKTSDNVKCIDIIMEILGRNYNCIICKVMASDFEVPQNRKRVLIIGIHKKYNIKPSEPIKIIENPENRIPVSSVLLSRENIEEKYYLSERAIQGINRKKERMINESKGFGAQFLNLDKPSFTIPSRYWKDGYDALVKYSDTEIRRLTITELKRIQTFPEEYIFSGSNKDVIIQIGNAVPCKLSYHIGKYIKSILEIIDDTMDKTMDKTIRDMTKIELINYCKKNHISRYSNKNKNEIIELIKNHR